MRIYFNTGNSLKFKTASKTLKAYGIEVVQKEIATPEIQSFNSEEVSRFSALHSAQKINAPVVKTDVSYSIKALKGFPGPYVKYINEWLSAKDILKLMQGITKRDAQVIEYLAYARPTGEIKTFKSVSNCRIADKILNPNKGSAFDKILIREGYKLPQNMLSQEELKKMFAKQVTVWHELGKYLQELRSKRSSVLPKKHCKKLIVFSGVDGAGKTTVIQALTKKLSEESIFATTFQNHEPFSTYWNVVKQIKQHCKAQGTPLSYELDRFLQSLELAIKAEGRLPRLLKDNDVVLCERYILDKIVYGQLRGNMGIARCALSAITTQPDLTFFLRVSPDTAIERIRKRDIVGDWKETPAMIYKANKLFEIEISKYPFPLFIVNAERTINAIVEEILKLLLFRLKSN